MRDPASTAAPFVVVLAGGVGSRFWPVSTPRRPKQLLPLAGPRPLIADTVERALALAPRERLRILARPELCEAFRRVLPELEPQNFLPEPRARGTGPALTWAAWHAESAEPGAVVVSLHADHTIDPLEGFRDTLRRAVAAAGGGRLLCVGVPPDRPEPGYGYVEAGEEIAPGIRRAVRFVEKPDRARAEAFAASGHHLWNTGIFVWRAADLLAAVRERAPEVARALPRLERDQDVEAFYEETETIAVDVAVMERAPTVAVAPAGFRWDDIGTWAGLARVAPRDSEGNVAVGGAVLRESEENVVWSEEGRVVLFGVRGLVVVHANGQLLVTTKEASVDLKRLLVSLPEGPPGDAS